MSDIPRSRSPRAPSIALDEALDRARKAYGKERLHPAPTEVIAQHIGYKTANSGPALQAIASLRYYGLLERPRDGLLAVSKDVEAFLFAPDDAVRRAFLLRFLRAPSLFAELLDKYPSGQPSDANLQYELIQRGFLPTTAATLVNVFNKSVEFAQHSESPRAMSPPSSVQAPELAAPAVLIAQEASAPNEYLPPAASSDADAGHDRIPVRLPGGRRAWLWIPTVFYESDKQRLKAQIDLLLTEDERP